MDFGSVTMELHGQSHLWPESPAPSPYYLQLPAYPAFNPFNALYSSNPLRIYFYNFPSLPPSTPLCNPKPLRLLLNIPWDAEYFWLFIIVLISFLSPWPTSLHLGNQSYNTSTQLTLLQPPNLCLRQTSYNDFIYLDLFVKFYIRTCNYFQISRS